MGITSMVLGILSFLISLGWFEDLSLILAILGTILGIIAIVKKQGRGMAIAGVILSVLALIILFGGSEETTSQQDSNSNTRRYAIEIYTDDKIDVKLTKIDDEYNEITFEVYNKTETTINFTLDLIEINGKTESPGFATEILSKTTAESCTYVSSTKDLTYLTAEFYIYDEDGYTISEFDVENILIK